MDIEYNFDYDAPSNPNFINDFDNNEKEKENDETLTEEQASELSEVTTNENTKKNPQQENKIKRIDISKLFEHKRSNHEIKRKIIKIIFLFIERKPNLLFFVVVNQKQIL